MTMTARAREVYLANIRARHEIGLNAMELDRVTWTTLSPLVQQELFRQAARDRGWLLEYIDELYEKGILE